MRPKTLPHGIAAMSRAGPDPSPGWLPPLNGMLAWAVLAMAVDIGFARFTFGVTLPAIRTGLGIDYTTGGLLGGLHLAGYLIGTLSVPGFVGRFGTTRLARTGHLLFALGAAASVLAPGVPVLAAGRLVSGVGAAAGVTSLFLIALESVEPRLRQAASAVIWAGAGLAVIASGAAVPWLLGSPLGWRGAFMASAVLAAALAAGFPPRRAAGDSRAPARSAAGTEPRRLSPADMLRPRWIFLVGAYTCFGAAYIAYATFTGARLASLGASGGLVQAVWISFGASCVLGSALAIALLRSPSGRRAGLTASLACCSAGAWAASGAGSAAAVLGAVLVGLGMTSGPSIVTAYLRERTSAADYPLAFSFATAGLGVGQLVGPVVAGVMADRLGPGSVPLLAAGIYAIAALFAALDEMLHRRPKGAPPDLELVGPEAVRPPPARPD